MHLQNRNASSLKDGFVPWLLSTLDENAVTFQENVVTFVIFQGSFPKPARAIYPLRNIVKVMKVKQQVSDEAG